MSTTTKTLYETDFVEWADTMAALMRAGCFDEVDVENVAEELEALGRAERKAVRSQLKRMMLHLLKQRIQPERDGRSWQVSIQSARGEILNDLKGAPSLKRYLSEEMEDTYEWAVTDALTETGLDRNDPALRAAVPNHCPWTLDELLRGDLQKLAPQ